MSIRDLADRLQALDLHAVAATALQTEAAAIADAVRSVLSSSDGDGHRFPREQTGALVASIVVSADGDGAVVGSSSDVAVYQEFGTANIPPRPFLAPVAADRADAAVQAVAASVTEALNTALRSS